VESEHFYARSLARFAAFLSPTAWKIASTKIERSLPAGTTFGRGWVGEFEPQSPPIIFVANRFEQPRSSRSINNASVGAHLGTTSTPRATDQNNGLFGASTFEPVGNNNNVREVQQKSNKAGLSTVGNSQVRRSRAASQSTSEMPQPFLKTPEVSTPRQISSASMGQNHNSVQVHSMGFITKQQVMDQSVANTSNASNSNKFQRSNVSLGALINQPGNMNRGVSSAKGFCPPVQSVKKEVESPKAVGPVISGQKSWISFGGPPYETKPSVNTVPASVPGSVPTFLGTQVRPTPNNVSHNAPVWRVVNTSPRGGTTLNNATQPPQGQNCNSNPGLVMFPVQRDLTRLQGQLPWQGLMPHNQHMQMKEPQTLRPDLNIGFNSPGSPPGQSSGINLEAQQPDLALQL
jgi:bromodomain-containing protein 9